MSKRIEQNNRIVVINEPKRKAKFEVYRVTLMNDNGHKTYVGFTSVGMRKRAQVHVDTPNRSVYDTFHESPSTLMVVEHLKGARTLDRARQLEKHYIKQERDRVGADLLNIQHTKKK